MNHGLGWKRDVVPPRLLMTAHRRYATQPLQERVDLVHFAAPMFDQGGLGSCGGHAIADACFASYAASGRPLDFIPSPDSIYRLARAVTRSHRGVDPGLTPLEDEGVYPSDAMEAIRRWGIREMGMPVDGRFSDCGVANVNREPSGEELEDSALHLIEEHRILTAHDLMEATGLGLACPTGIFVDTWFEEWMPRRGLLGAPRNPRDPNGGGHYVDCLGYVVAGLMSKGTAQAILPERMLPIVDNDWRVLAQQAAVLPPEDPVYFFKNSWGPRWGLNGYFLATRSLIDAPTTGDINAIDASYREAA